jgi:phytoene dehydrogenase-like protein
MGKITQSLKQSAVDFGTEIFTNATVKRITWENNTCTNIKF